MPYFRFAARTGGINGTQSSETPSTAMFVAEKMSGKTIVSAGYSGNEPNIASLDLHFSNGASIFFRTDERGTLVTYCTPEPRV